jgi:hypothetical protein
MGVKALQFDVTFTISSLEKKFIWKSATGAKVTSKLVVLKSIPGLCYSPKGSILKPPTWREHFRFAIIFIIKRFITFVIDCSAVTVRLTPSYFLFVLIVLF